MTKPGMSRRAAAIATLVLLAAAAAAVVAGAVDAFPRGLVAAGVLAVAVAAAWEGLRRRGAARTGLLVAGAVLAVVAVVLTFTGGLILETLLAVAFAVASTAFVSRTFAVHDTLPPAPRPAHPVVIWNPRSGGGKALAADLAAAARARGIEPIELTPGDDLERLVHDAVERGADALAAAGGDGTQALVAAIAAERGLPFACIPAGTRNHFALDLGVDRDDVVGALDALVDGGERRVDLAEVNGRTFVNNVSLGLYAEAVQREGYREAKLRTILDTAPDVLGAAADAAPALGWTGPDGERRDSAAVILVSNNAYRLGRAVGSGTRPRVDAGVLGVAVMEGAGEGGRRPALRQWTAREFVVDAPGPVPAGVDGEALTMDPPLRFTIRPGVLRLRLAPHHPGASPSAALPPNLWALVRATAAIAAGRTS